MFTYFIYYIGRGKGEGDGGSDVVWDLDLYGLVSVVLFSRCPHPPFHFILLFCFFVERDRHSHVVYIFSLLTLTSSPPLLSPLHPLLCSSTVQVQSRDGRRYKHREIAVDLQLAAYMMHIIYVLLEERPGMEWFRGKILRCNLRGFYVHNYHLLQSLSYLVLKRIVVDNAMHIVIIFYVHAAM